MGTKTKKKVDEQIRIAFQVRMTEAERLTLETVAGLRGLPLSTWMRIECLEAARKWMRDRVAEEGAGS